VGRCPAAECCARRVAMGPKSAGGREIVVEGLPPGWIAIEKTYLSGSYAGKTYLRFQNDVHRNVLSLNAAVKLDAEDRGLDVDAVVAEYKMKLQMEKEAAAKEREEAGNLKGQKRDEAIERFRAEYGKLDGSTITCFPGWRGESKQLENCGQITARYYDPEGRQFALLKDIEAYFGMLMERGEQIPDIEAARNGRQTDESGRVVVAARKNLVEQLAPKPESQLKNPHHKKRRYVDTIASESDYQEIRLDVMQLRCNSADDLNAHGVPGAQSMKLAAEQIYSGLRDRGFPEQTDVLYVKGGGKVGTDSEKLLDFVGGIYFQMSETFHGRPWYQKVLVLDHGVWLFSCRGLYIFWSGRRNGWKIGVLDDSKAGLVICCADEPTPVKLKGPWLLYAPERGVSSN